MTLWIFTQQKASLPSWAPFVGQDYAHITGEFTTAQAVTPGQGQAVDIAGIQVGKVTSVNLEDGHAVVGLDIEPRYLELIRPDATLLLRPKTNLNDMIVEVDPGTAPGHIEDGDNIPLSRTQPNVNFEAFLSTLDGDTRQYLQLLLAGGAQGIGGRGRQLSSAFRRLQPFSHYIADLNREVAKRRVALADVIHNFGLLTTELARRDSQIERFVTSSKDALGDFAAVQASLQESLVELPSTLQVAREGLASSDRFSTAARPALIKLIPQAQALGPAFDATERFFRETTVPIRDQIRPFTRQIRPVLTHLSQGSSDFEKSVQGFGNSLGGSQRALQHPRLQAEGQGELPLLRSLAQPQRHGQLCAGRRRSGAPGPGPDQLQRHRSRQRLRRGPAIPENRSPGGQHPDRQRTARHRTRSESARRRLRPDLRQMSKQAPSTGQLLVIAGFALSCFGILLFLWITFGGATPFRAKTYEIRVPFAEATQLAEQSDVRISGVSVGKVKSIGLAPDGVHALARIDILDQYAPIPRETRAILRTKTLLGETYVELTPSSSDREMLPDGGTLAAANVAESVQLDEIFRTFDPETQAAFRTWMQDAAVAIQGRGEDFSNVFAELEPTFATFDRLFRVLDTQRLAVRQLFRNGEVTFRAFRGRNDELDDLIQSSNTVFTTAAARNRDIEALFRAFPTFLDESRLTLERLESFALNADPLFRQLIPAAEELSPTLIAFSRFAPQAKGFFEGFAPVIARAPRAFPALRKIFRDDFPPLLRALDPFLRNLNPLHRRPQPLQTRDHRSDGQHRRDLQRRRHHPL